MGILNLTFPNKQEYGLLQSSRVILYLKLIIPVHCVSIYVYIMSILCLLYLYYTPNGVIIFENRLLALSLSPVEQMLVV